jgi:hypothetical protein
MFSYDGKDRLTLQQIREHPWTKQSIDHEKIRIQLLEELKFAREKKPVVTSREYANSRGDDLKEMVQTIDDL